MAGSCLACGLWLGGCAAHRADPVLPDEIVLPQEAVPPGVKPLTREEEELAAQ